MTIVAMSGAVVAYGQAPSPADALWGWLFDTLWHLTGHDEEVTTDAIERYGIRVLGQSGALGDDYTEEFALIDLESDDDPGFHVETGE